jgi:hypothetical protein
MKEKRVFPFLIHFLNEHFSNSLNQNKCMDRRGATNKNISRVYLHKVSS